MRVLVAIFLLGPLAAGSAMAAPPDSLSIAQCIEKARAHAPDVQSARADLRAARYDSLASTRNRRPAASLFGGVLIAPHGFYAPATTDLGQYQIKAGITIPLRDGGAAARERARAANEAELAGFRMRSVSREAGLRAGQIAVEILAREERERYEAESLAWITELESIIGSRVRAGVSGTADSMRIGLERDAVEAALDSTRTGASAARRELAALLGVPVEDLPPIRPTTLAEIDPMPADSIALLGRFMERPEITIARGQEAQARLDMADVRHQSDLVVGASGDAGIAGTDLTAWVPAEMRAEDPSATFVDRLRQDLGASVSIDFHRGLITPTLGPAVDARRSAAEAAHIRSASTIALQERNALDLLDRWHAASRAFRKTRSTVGRSELNLIRTKSLYIAGAAGILDVLDARRTLDDARERLVDARAQSRNARIEAEAIP